MTSFDTLAQLLFVMCLIELMSFATVNYDTTKNNSKKYYNTSKGKKERTSQLVVTTDPVLHNGSDTTGSTEAYFAQRLRDMESYWVVGTALPW